MDEWQWLMERRGEHGWYKKVYTTSLLWQTIRLRVLERDNWQCKMCRGEGNTVHHMSYADDVLKGENDGELITLCGSCHGRIEYRFISKEIAPNEKLRRFILGNIVGYVINPSIVLSKPPKSKKIIDENNEDKYWRKAKEENIQICSLTYSYTIKDLAKAVGLTYRTVLGMHLRGEFRIGDLKSIMMWSTKLYMKKWIDQEKSKKYT